MTTLINHLRRMALFYLVVATTVVTTVLISQKLRHQIDRRDAERSGELRREQLAHVQKSISRYHSMMNDLRSLLELSQDSGTAGWETYIDGLEWFKRYPALLEIGHAARQESPVGMPPDYLVTWSRGSLGNSRQGLGAVLNFEKPRSEALALAIRTHALAGTPPLAVDSSNRLANVLFQPVGLSGLVASNITEWDERATGVIFAVVDPELLAREIAADWTSPLLTLKPQLADPVAGGFERVFTVASAGVSLRFGCALTPRFQEDSQRHLATLVLVLGLVFAFCFPESSGSKAWRGTGWRRRTRTCAGPSTSCARTGKSCFPSRKT